jgi:hypothetical protein
MPMCTNMQFSANTVKNFGIYYHRRV